MVDIVTYYTKGAALSTTEADEHVEESVLAYNSATLTPDDTHNREHIVCGGSVTAIEFTATATLSAALDKTGASTPIGWSVKISNNSGAAIPINGNGLQFNGGTSTYSLPDNGSVIIGFDDASGTKGYFILAAYSPAATAPVFVSESSLQATTSGTSHTISGISTWATQVDVILKGVSTDGSTDEVGIQLGHSGGLVQSGYVGAVDNDNTAATDWGGTEAVVSTGATDAEVQYQVIQLTKTDDDVWIITSAYTYRNRSPNNMTIVSGYVDVGATLDRVALIVTGTPTDAFDAGGFMLRWR